MKHAATFEQEFCGAELTVTVSGTFDGETFDVTIDEVECGDGWFEHKNACYRQPDGVVIDFLAFIENKAVDALFAQNEVTVMTKGQIYGGEQQ